MNLKELNKPKSFPLQKLTCSFAETLKNPKYIKQTIKSLEGIELEYLFCHGYRNSRLLSSHFKASVAPASTWEVKTFSMERCRFHFSRQRYEGGFLLLHHRDDGIFLRMRQRFRARVHAEPLLEMRAKHMSAAKRMARWPYVHPTSSLTIQFWMSVGSTITIHSIV